MTSKTLSAITLIIASLLTCTFGTGCSEDRPVWITEDDGEGGAGGDTMIDDDDDGNDGNGGDDNNGSGGNNDDSDEVPPPETDYLRFYTVELKSDPAKGEFEDHDYCQNVETCYALLEIWLGEFADDYVVDAKRKLMHDDAHPRNHFINEGTAYPGPTLETYKKFGVDEDGNPNGAAYCGVVYREDIGDHFEFDSTDHLWLVMKIEGQTYRDHGGNIPPVDVDEGDKGPIWFCVAARTSFKLHWVD